MVKSSYQRKMKVRNFKAGVGGAVGGLAKKLKDSRKTAEQIELEAEGWALADVQKSLYKHRKLPPEDLLEAAKTWLNETPQCKENWTDPTITLYGTLSLIH